MANEGANRLARVLQGRIKDLDDKPPVLDYGVINWDRSLKTNMFPLPIPQSSYMICRSAQGCGPGDRVLVAWTGNDACVIDVIMPAAWM